MTNVMDRRSPSLHERAEAHAEAGNQAADQAGQAALSAPSTPNGEINEPSQSEQSAAARATGIRGWWQRRKEFKQLEGNFDSYPHLLALKPKEKVVFRSDYFEVDDSVACVLAFFHQDSASDDFAAFWGIDRIPSGLDDRVTAVVLEQVKRREQNWVDQNTKKSERLDNLDAAEQAESGTTSSRRRAAKASLDLELAISEIQDGASYLSVHNRLLLKAPDLETLEDSVERVARLYIDRFGTLKAEAYAGEQRQELSALWKNNDDKRGKGFHFTSTELAGSYALVTNGLHDRGGEYVGLMTGDVNNSAVLLDVNNYADHVVVADSTQTGKHLGNQRWSNLWGSKIAQACMIGNGSVVHLVLDGTDLSLIGPAFSNITSTVDLNAGEVNMFEMFGDYDEELVIFPMHIEKLKLMFAQLHATENSMDAALLDNALSRVAQQFYIDQKMWHADAQNHRDELRLVNLDHTQVPRLQLFVSYLNAELSRVKVSNTYDTDKQVYDVLHGIAESMLDVNGDLFNNHTDDAIDHVRGSKRVVYDLSQLMRRGKGVAMAQLVNIIGFAVSTLGENDTVIIHGTEVIDDRVKGYLGQQLGMLHERRGRVVYCYNDVDKMLADREFNTFDAADYTILGPMRDTTVDRYQKLLGRQIPPDLEGLITRRGQEQSFLRRGVTNVVFQTDLALGINPEREAQRRKIIQEAAKAEEASQMDRLMSARPVAGAHMTSARSDDSEVPLTKRQSKRVRQGAKAQPAAATRRSLRQKAAGEQSNIFSTTDRGQA